MQNVKIDDYEEFLYNRAVECIELLSMIDAGIVQIRDEIGFFRKLLKYTEIKKMIIAKQCIKNLLNSYSTSYLLCSVLRNNQRIEIEIEQDSEFYSKMSHAKSIFKELCL